MYIKIKSENPNLSYVLRKNPSSGMVAKTYRKGVVFGWFNESLEYNLYFKDGDDEISIQKDVDGFEFNDIKRYDSPTLVMACFNQIIKDVVNDKPCPEDKDGEYMTEIEVNLFHMYDTKYFNILSRYYKDIEIILTETASNQYNVIMRSNKSIAFNVRMLFVIASLYHSKTDLYIEDGEVIKYSKILAELNTPYFFRYVFKTNYVHSDKMLDKVRENLEAPTGNENISLSVGNTHRQREMFIKDNVHLNCGIVDVGCGELGSYAKQMVSLMTKESLSIDYHAIDIDVDTLNYGVNKLKRKYGNDINLYSYESFDEFKSFDSLEGKFDYILSEFFEHVKLKVSDKIIKSIINKGNFNQIIITTPNKEFNQFYNLGEDVLRLDDHVFEMTKGEFEEHFKQMLKKEYHLEYSIHDIGDVVNGISPTQAIIIKRKK